MVLDNQWQMNLIADKSSSVIHFYLIMQGPPGLGFPQSTKDVLPSLTQSKIFKTTLVFPP